MVRDVKGGLARYSERMRLGVTPGQTVQENPQETQKFLPLLALMSELRALGSVEVSSEITDREMALEKAIAALTDDQRELVKLKFMQGLSNASIAEITGYSLEAIKALQFRVLKTMHEMLGRVSEGGGYGT